MNSRLLTMIRGEFIQVFRGRRTSLIKENK